MITVNLASGCVSRDICQPFIEQNTASVLQYVGYSSMFSMVSEKADITANIENLKTVDISNFFKRGFCQDYNKTDFSYLFAKKSDYFIIGVSKARHPLLKKGEHLLTRVALPNLFSDETVRSTFNLDAYEEIMPSELSDDFYEKTAEQFCDIILSQYRLNQIILHKYYEATEFNDNGVLRSFDPEHQEEIARGNSVLRKLYDLLEEKLKGCHVIEWPDYVISDVNNVWGLNPLHFFKDYYDYGYDALKTIFKGLPYEQENAELKSILDHYNIRFRLIHDNLQFTYNKQASDFTIRVCNNVIAFLKELAFDNYGRNNFNRWLEKAKAENKKIAVLKAEDSAGQVLRSALDARGIEITFSTVKADLKSLTDEEMNQCARSDIIVCADVHSEALVERNGIKAIRIHDILRNS